MGDTIGPNAREKAKRRPQNVVRPAQPLHDRVGVDHTPARLAERQLLRTRDAPLELCPEPAQGRVQPSLSDHLGTVVVVDKLSRATPLCFCEVSRELNNLRALEIHQDTLGHHESWATLSRCRPRACPSIKVQLAPVIDAITRRLRGWGGNRVRRKFATSGRSTSVQRSRPLSTRSNWVD